MDYQNTGKQIVEAVGGSENIKNLSFCATRLRLILNDNSKFNKEAIDNISGVKGTIKVGNQQQLIIGSEVSDLYNAITKNYSISSDVSENDETKSVKPHSIKEIFIAIGNFFQNSIGVAILPMTGAGMIKALLVVLSSLGWLDAKGNTYAMMWAATDAVMFFIPVFLAYGAAQRLKCNTSMALLTALITLTPYWTNAIANGTATSLFGINTTMFSFSYQYVPVLLSVYIYAQLEKFFKAHIVDVLQAVLTPALCLLIMIPFTFLIEAPAFAWLSGALASPAAWLAQNRLVAIPLLAMLWPTLTIFGMHGAVYGATYILYFSIYKYDPIALTSYLATHLTIGFTALYAAYASKDKTTKEIGISSGLTMLFGCISEPAIFGILLKNRKLYLSQTLAAGITAVFVALFGIKNYIVGVPASLLGLPGFFGTEYSPVLVILLVPIALVSSVVLARLIDRKPKAADIA